MIVIYRPDPHRMGEEYVYDVEKGRKFYIRPVAMGEVRASVTASCLLIHCSPERTTLNSPIIDIFLYHCLLGMMAGKSGNVHLLSRV